MGSRRAPQIVSHEQGAHPLAVALTTGDHWASDDGQGGIVVEEPDDFVRPIGAEDDPATDKRQELTSRAPRRRVISITLAV